MKPLLIGLNIFLLGALIFALAGYFDDEVPEMTVVAPPAAVASGSAPGNSTRAGLSAENIRNIVASSTAFSSTSGAAGARNGQTVQLVGTVIAGDNSSAILLIRANNRRDNWPPNGQQNGNGNAQTAADYSFKQYVKLGETNAGGYKLVSLSANKAVLTRGGERLELELQPASANAPATTANNNRNRQNRAFNNRDALAMQMMQNMQMIQIMNRLVQGQQQRATGTSSGRRSSSGANSGNGGGFGGGFGGGGFGGGGFGGAPR